MAVTSAGAVTDVGSSGSHSSAALCCLFPCRLPGRQSRLEFLQLAFQRSGFGRLLLFQLGRLGARSPFHIRRALSWPRRWPLRALSLAARGSEPPRLRARPGRRPASCDLPGSFCIDLKLVSISFSVAGRLSIRMKISLISFLIILFVGDELGQVVARIADRFGNGRSADQRHDRAQAAGRWIARIRRRFRAAGRPNVARKPLGSSTPESGSSAARVPGATPGNFDDAPMAAIDRVVQHFGRQAPGDGVRIIDLVVLVPAVGDERKLVGPRLDDQLDRCAAR